MHTKCYNPLFALSVEYNQSLLNLSLLEMNIAKPFYQQMVNPYEW